MKAGRGKAKGSGFERLVCKDLSAWVSHGTRQDLFWRSAMSGGRATVFRKRGTKLAAHAGDISATDPMGHWLLKRFMVECKSYRDLQVLQGILKKTGSLYKFWSESFHPDFLSTGREPLLIAHQNNMPTLLLTTNMGARYGGLRTNTAKQFLVASLPQWEALVYLYDVIKEVPCPRSD